MLGDGSLWVSFVFGWGCVFC